MKNSRHGKSLDGKAGFRRGDVAARLVPALFIVTTVVAACGGGGGGGGAQVSDAAQAGKAQFDRVCATCHGKDANGLPRLGKSLRNNEFTASKSDAELVEFLKEGRAASHPLNTTGVDMPPRGGDPSITDQDLQNIVAYLRTL